MDEPVLERRMLLRGAGVAGASVAGVAAVPAAASARGHHDRRVVGAWKITHTDDPQRRNSPGVGLVAFAPGGSFTTTDIDPAGPTGIGAWESEEHRFWGTFWQGTSGDGSDEPAVVVKVRVRGRVHGDRISGRYRGTVYLAKDDSVVGTFTGVFSGHRLEA